MEFLLKAVGAVVLIILLVGVFSLIGGIPTYFLWNWLMPEIFGFKVITFGQAVGLNFLTGILFKSSSSSSSKE